MRTTILSFCLVVLSGNVFGQSPEPPLSNKNLTIHTLVREDIFAGWRADDMKRFERGEKNIETLLEQRPESKADLLSWKGGTKLFRAVLAHEADKKAEFESYFKQARELFAEASKLGPNSVGVAAVNGGSYVMFADRLPEEYREAAWSDAYDNYKVLWKMQAKHVDKMPVHISGELLAGLAQSSHRTGRTEEMNQHLDKIIEVLPKTTYARVAKSWKENPSVAGRNSIACKTCHNPGKLSAQLRQK